MYVRERVRLFWARQVTSALQRLSTNVLREVCIYLDAETLLPFCKSGDFGLFNVASRETLHYPEAPDFPRGAVLCFIGCFRVMCLGKTTSTCILTPTCRQDSASMAEARYYPGCIHYIHCVYAFGGSSATSCSAEKYSVQEDHWTALPHMNASRYAFSPVRHEQSIYLAEVNEASHMLEVFDTVTERFSVLSTSLPFAGYSSIAFISREELTIVDFTGRRVRMQMQKGADIRKDEVLLSGVECYSQSVPVLLGRAVFFSQYKSGETVRFSIDSGVFEVIV